MRQQVGSGCETSVSPVCCHRSSLPKSVILRKRVQHAADQSRNTLRLYVLAGVDVEFWFSMPSVDGVNEGMYATDLLYNPFPDDPGRCGLGSGVFTGQRRAVGSRISHRRQPLDEQLQQADRRGRGWNLDPVRRERCLFSRACYGT